MRATDDRHQLMVTAASVQGRAAELRAIARRLREDAEDAVWYNQRLAAMCRDDLTRTRLTRDIEERGDGGRPDG